jgi:hypothetical protein
MSTPDTSKPSRSSARWAVPAVSVVAGVGYFVAGLVGDNLRFGVFGLLLMLGFGALFLLGSRRSETLAGLRDRRDERINQLDMTATVVAGNTVLVAVLALFMVEIAQGKDGSPYSALGALGGLTYVVTLLYLRYRR